MRRRSPALEALKPQLAAAAQEVYDEWDENLDEYGGGGICHLIAEAMVGVLDEHDIDATEQHTTIDENHVFVLAQDPNGAGIFYVDIPPSTYEVGSGYSWSKIKGSTSTSETWSWTSWKKASCRRRTRAMF